MNKKQSFRFSLFSVVRKKSRLISLIMAFAFLNLSASCAYYKSKPIAINPDNFAGQYKSVNKKERYVILHSGTEIWHLNNLVLNEDTKEITASVDDVDYGHSLYPLKAKKRSRGYNPHKSDKTLEIHLYTNVTVNKNTTPHIDIPFANIEKMEVYKPDVARLM